MFKNSSEGFLWMEAFTNFEKAPDLTKRGYRLDRMKLLLECFDNPQDFGRTIHIAGSKGKGSTAAFTSSILREAGFLTGVYSSPHISDYRERITINGLFAAEEIYIKNMNLIKDLIEDQKYLSLPGGSEPTTFELLTLLAFLVFRDMKCQWVVLETGLGGRLDATNLVNPDLVLLTPIELEHTDLLGDTISLIASEKAGIIKEGKPVVSSSQKEEAQRVFEDKARSQKASIHFVPDLLSSINCHMADRLSQVQMHWKNGRINKSHLKLLGEHQSENCALAIAGIHRVLPELQDSFIDKAVSQAFIPGRMEYFEGNPPFFIDSAHTARSVEKTLKTYQELFQENKVLIFGSVDGKDFKSMAQCLAPHFDHIIVSRPGTFKKSNPQAVFEEFHKINPHTCLIEDPEKAQKKAVEFSGTNGSILVTGSFYMAAEIRNILK